MENKEIVAFGNDDVLDTNGKIGLSELNVVGVVAELLLDHLIEGHVGGHDDQRIVHLTRDGSFVGKIHRRSIEEFEDGVVGVGGEFGFVPVDAVVDVGLVFGKPLRESDGINGAE